MFYVVEDKDSFIETTSQATGLNLAEQDGRLVANDVDWSSLSQGGESVISAIESTSTIKMEMVSDVDSVVFDSFEKGGSGPVDAGDFSKIAETQSSDFTEALVTHVFTERRVSAETGAGFSKAHSAAKSAEASVFGGTHRSASTSSGRTTFTYSKGGVLGIGRKKVGSVTYPSDSHGNPE